MRVPSLLAAAAALMLTTGAAHAANASAERAAGLERDIGAWVADMIGSAVKLPMRPVRVEPAGDSYRVVVPFGGDVPALTATLREERLRSLESAALLRRVMGEIDAALFAFDEDGRLRLVNRAGERLLGRAAGPEAHDNHLGIRDVGKRLNGRVQVAVAAARHQQRRHEKDEEAVLQREGDNA